MHKQSRYYITASYTTNPLSLLKTGSGITSGSFLDPGYNIRIDSETHYYAPSPRIGFRVIAVRKK